MANNPNIIIKFKVIKLYPMWFGVLIQRMDFIILSWVPNQILRTFSYEIVTVEAYTDED